MYNSIANQPNVYLGVELCFINWVVAVNIEISVLITWD